MEIVAIVVAAGRGSRAGAGGPKQYRTLRGEPVLTRTLRGVLAEPRITAVQCVIHPDDHDLYSEAVSRFDPKRLRPPVHGGATRQQSVHRALETLADGGDATLCLVHDAARPFVSPDLLRRAIDAGSRAVAAVPGLPVSDTIKVVSLDGTVTGTPDRGSLRAIQTPQAFTLGPLLAAHRRACEQGLDSFTDDGHLAEWAGLTVHVFEGDPMNTKITHPGDLAEAERRLDAPPLAVRVGTGFDVHAFGPGDHVWLGGVRIAHETGVLAHSDGDVVLHALTDALLGALGDGDIGTHFPPSDPQWRGASSDRFLAYAADKVRAAGGKIDHLDVTVLCEAPRVGPHRDAMRERIASVVGITTVRVSIKATTTEKLGFTGRAEGLAAQAAATVRLPDVDA